MLISKHKVDRLTNAVSSTKKGKLVLDASENEFRVRRLKHTLYFVGVVIVIILLTNK